MCGIFCSICKNNYNASSNGRMLDLLQRRGPDKSNSVNLHVDEYKIAFAASVLHMQGTNITEQPAASNAGNLLLFNGEIFGGIEIVDEQSDTTALLGLLDACQSIYDVVKVFELIEGPWAFIYFQKSSKMILFGRDYFGRRSLLISMSSNQLKISSVTTRPVSSSDSWFELPTGIYCLNCEDKLQNVVKISWRSIFDREIRMEKSELDCIYHRDCFLNSPISTNRFGVKPPRPPCYEVESCKADGDQIALVQLVDICEHKNLWSLCERLNNVLEKALHRRTHVLDSWDGSSKVGVLFSGGIDCSVLALLADRTTPSNEPIDLLNIAFEKTSNNSICDEKENIFNVPDRVTGLSSFEELKKLCPNRLWNFVEINITVEELRRIRSNHIADLTYPKQTVLDDSIACALWFASRGEGTIHGKNKDVYKSSARILLCGMGADEQLGGYSRHRTVYTRSSDWGRVEEEITMEIERISSRNLGRDDRIIADHGREARFPYLDAEVVGFLSSLPVHQKADFRYERGIGEKIVLRGAAYLLGFRQAAVLPKRAIQFGSRIAKIDSSREKGSDKCSRLTSGPQENVDGSIT